MSFDQPRFYGRRKGRTLKVQAKERFNDLLPEFTFTLADFNPSSGQCIWLEIGFGGGEHLAFQAEKNPEVYFIGAEAFYAGVAHMVGYIQDKYLENVKIFPDDVRLILPELADGIFEKVFLLFPDPWPKKRHGKRRFIQDEMMQTIWNKLKPGGFWHVASDHPIYQEWVHEKMIEGLGKKLFRQIRKDPIERPDLDEWPQTRYEQKALREGRTPNFWIFEKLP
jgi:tRNA (guanine-N7-)-methyltransferase